LCIYIYIYYLRGCPSQLARTTTNFTAHWTPCKPNEHIRYRESDRYAHKNSNLEATREDKPLLSQANTLSASYCIYLVTSNKFKWCTVHLLKSFFFLQSADPLQSFHNNWVHVLLIPNSSKLLFTNVPKTQKRKNQTEILLHLHNCFFLNRSSLWYYCNNLLKQCKALKTWISWSDIKFSCL